MNMRADLPIMASAPRGQDFPCVRPRRLRPRYIEEAKMYYSSGNYEAFARPEKPEGIERKSA